MAGILEYNRLEDFISLAKNGEEVNLSVSLNKQLFTRKFFSSALGDAADEIDMYILSAAYLFAVEGVQTEVKKLYALGIEGESADSTGKNVQVANDRLSMDYRRLKEAGIVFAEKFWDDQLLEVYEP
jgi:hypothetical protein